jgi:competence protein ComEC
MGVGCFVMALAAFNWVPFYPAKILEISIYYLDKIIGAIASLKQFIIKDIPLNTSLLISSYLVIITIIIGLEQKNFRSIVWALIAIITFQLSAITTKWQIHHQAEFIVWNASEKTKIIVRLGAKVQLYTNAAFLKNIKNDKALTSYLTANFSTLNEKHQLKNLMYFKENKILVIDSSKAYPKNIQPDILIIIQSPKINFERLLQNTKPKIVIADASNYRSLQKRWKATCSQQKIPFHATREKGFYKID